MNTTTTQQQQQRLVKILLCLVVAVSCALMFVRAPEAQAQQVPAPDTAIAQFEGADEADSLPLASPISDVLEGYAPINQAIPGLGNLPVPPQLMPVIGAVGAIIVVILAMVGLNKGGGSSENAGGISTPNKGSQKFSGTIRDMSGYQFAKAYPKKMANPPYAGQRVLFLELDKPSSITADQSGNLGKYRTDTTTMIRLGRSSGGKLKSAYLGRNGEHVTITVNPKICMWPSDTAAPLGAPNCKI
ncbi:hypothetical protein [Corynebacterium aquilae]|uniref:Uncharacterized protein n=1 Tax=Corynebacterium aquilae DSM 44791 TaxID=1431546 RepID=A0A1L7CII6_9CORY|nr:hypothetical protein [Corynebacterium aquilae]APT85676.1 hypothetical protein CAQU_12225 [Corynebacterium aquilae DSM 44791]